MKKWLLDQEGSLTISVETIVVKESNNMIVISNVASSQRGVKTIGLCLKKLVFLLS